MNNVSEILKKIVLPDERPQVLVCTVDKVNGAFCDVTPIDKDIAPLTDVRLNAYSEQSDFLITPKVNSYVVVAKIGMADAYVALFSAVEKVCIKNSDYSLRQAFDDLLDAINRLTVTTGTGPSGTPINATEFTQIKDNISNLLV